MAKLGRIAFSKSEKMDFISHKLDKGQIFGKNVSYC